MKSIVLFEISIKGLVINSQHCIPMLRFFKYKNLFFKFQKNIAINGNRKSIWETTKNIPGNNSMTLIGCRKFEAVDNLSLFIFFSFMISQPMH